MAFIRDECIPHPWRRSICLDVRCKGDIGFAIATKYWGQGIATKTLKAALSQVFKDLPDLVKLQAFVPVENMASQTVLEKAGFLREGILRKYTYVKGNLRDLVVFSFLMELFTICRILFNFSSLSPLC